MAEVPPNPSHAGPIDADRSLGARVDAIEQRIDAAGLGGEDEYRTLLIDEVRQRMRLRRWLSVLAVVVIVVMICVVFHASHMVPLWQNQKVHPAYSIATIVTPLVSISAITIALLVGAFRRFQDKDMDRVDVTSIMSEAAKIAARRS